MGKINFGVRVEHDVVGNVFLGITQYVSTLHLVIENKTKARLQIESVQISIRQVGFFFSPKNETIKNNFSLELNELWSLKWNIGHLFEKYEGKICSVKVNFVDGDSEESNDFLLIIPPVHTLM